MSPVLVVFIVALIILGYTFVVGLLNILSPFWLVILAGLVFYAGWFWRGRKSPVPEMVYLLISSAGGGQTIAVFPDHPTRQECDEVYSAYLNKPFSKGISLFNCFVEQRIVDGQPTAGVIVKPLDVDLEPV